MKARVKATGEIIEISTFQDINKIPTTYDENELEFFIPTDYWTRLEHQAAIAAMQGKMAQGDNFGNSREEICNKIANYCIDVADTLIKKLKEKEEKK